jgi:hypothetical protein
MSALRAAGSFALRLFSSFGLSCVLVLLLGLLTWLGTLEQVHTGLYEVQKKYFESFVLLHDFGPFSIPLPGANLVLCVLAVNLIVGGVVRLRRTRATWGVLVAHFGILLLLLSGFIKTYFADEGHVTLFEGQRSGHYQSYYLWELAVSEPLGPGRAREHVAPQERFAGASAGHPVRLSSGELPFELEVERLFANCEPLPKGPMFEVAVPVIDGVFLRERPRDPDAERNIAGAYVSAIGRDGARLGGMLWGAEAAPLTLKVDGRTFAVQLRKRRYPMPFSLELERFTKEDHPRLDMPKSFSSDVTVVEGASERPVEISMNEPLRTAGLVLYQASWGPAGARPGDPLFSTFAVVRNPADRLPLYACIVIALGLAGHFSRKLVLHVRAEARRA